MSVNINRIEPSASDPQQATIVFENNTEATGSYDVQISPRPDFRFCACPAFSVPGPGAASFAVTGLNRAARYWVRARTRSGAGVVSPWSAIKSFTTLRGADPSYAPANVMIEPALIVRPEPWSEAISPYSASGFPFSNLAIDAPVAWRSVPLDANGYCYVDMKMDGALIDTIALLNTNLPETAQMTIQALNADRSLIELTLWSASFRASASLGQRPYYHGLARLP